MLFIKVGTTALMKAIRIKNVEVVRYLIFNAKVDVNQQNLTVSSTKEWSHPYQYQ